jgi:uncharacterized protein (DUF885 family)
MDLRASLKEIGAAKGTLDEGERLHRLLSAVWGWTMQDRPEYATYVGYPGQNDRWTDQSPEAIEERKRIPREILAALEGFDTSKLSPSDRLNYDLFRRDAEEEDEAAGFPGEYLQLTSMGGPHSSVAQIIALMPAGTDQDAADLLSRLRGIPTVLEQAADLLARGLEAGVTQPRVVLRGMVDQISAQIVDDPKQSALLQPLTRSNDAPTGGLDEASRIYTSEIGPAVERFRKFVGDDYIPGCRDAIARSELPGGEDWYAHLVRRYTTTETSPKEIHEIGMNEVERIRSLMDKTIEEAAFDGSFEEFTAFLREDRQFYFDDPEDLLRTYRDISKRADPELARLFGVLPRLPYGVVPVPSYIEKTTTTAYYQPGSPEVGRAGYFYANTYDLKARPKWEMEALTLHEAVPGHHLQIALAQELEGLPEFRRHGRYTAYVEGWGLYAESLGEEMGFYQDPYSRFGQATYEMWRAIRLVVDTGMHALGWSRDRAIEFFRANTGKTEHDIVVEVDRYISWPGQALAYKIGELKIKELRALAEESLGDSFDLRAFHDELLGQGALPLTILQERIRDWIERDNT